MSRAKDEKEFGGSELKNELDATLDRATALAKQLEDAKRTLEIERSRAHGMITAMNKEVQRWKSRKSSSGEEWRSAHGSVKLENGTLRDALANAEAQLAAAKSELAQTKDALSKASHTENAMRSTLDILERRSKSAETEAAKVRQQEEARKARATEKLERKADPVGDARPVTKDVARN